MCRPAFLNREDAKRAAKSDLLPHGDGSRPRLQQNWISPKEIASWR